MKKMTREKIKKAQYPESPNKTALMIQWVTWSLANILKVEGRVDLAPENSIQEDH